MLNKVAYIGVIEKSNSYIVDGYSKSKTLRGVCHDIGKCLESIGICENDAKGFMRVRTNSEAEEMLLQNNFDGEYYFEAEEVGGCASMFNEDTDEMEYKEGYYYYFCTNIIK